LQVVTPDKWGLKRKRERLRRQSLPSVEKKVWPKLDNSAFLVGNGSVYILILLRLKRPPETGRELGSIKSGYCEKGRRVKGKRDCKKGTVLRRKKSNNLGKWN